MSYSLVMASAAASVRTVYRHVDEQGNVSYSDRPSGEKVTLAPLTVVPATPQASSSSSSNG